MAEENKKVFDPAREITVKIPAPNAADGFKRANVRFPGDEEWKERLRRQETVIRALGRGSSETEVLNDEDVNAELFAQIRTDKEGGPEFDKYEASAAISTLVRTKCLALDRVGCGYRVDLRVLGGVFTSHFLNMPSQKQIAEYRKAACRPRDHRHNITTLRFSLEPAGQLYDALFERVEGYAANEKGGVPIVHKAAAVQEIRADLDAMMEEPDPED